MDLLKLCLISHIASNNYTPDVRTISHFAQLEYKHGEPEKGATMFENVLTSYPGRLDLWSVYLDKTIALGDHEQTR